MRAIVVVFVSINISMLHNLIDAFIIFIIVTRFTHLSKQICATALTVNARPNNAIHGTNGYQYNTAPDPFTSAVASHVHGVSDMGTSADNAAATGVYYENAALADDGSIKTYLHQSDIHHQSDSHQQSGDNHHLENNGATVSTVHLNYPPSKDGVDFGIASEKQLSDNSANIFNIASTVGSVSNLQKYTENSASIGPTIRPAGPTISSSPASSILSTTSLETAKNRKTFVVPSSIDSTYTTASHNGRTKVHTSLVQPSQLPPIITKSFYFEAAPEEPEEQQEPRFVSIGRAQKNYKVIFIKAPSYGLNSQIIPVLPQNEDKTIIYVLSKKPEFNQNIELPPVPTTEPSKPEIFFVKYKSEQEALDAQHKIKHVYETEQSASSLEADDESDRRIHTIVSEAVPNVFSASAAASTQEHVHQHNAAEGDSSSAEEIVEVDIEQHRNPHRLSPSGFTLVNDNGGLSAEELTSTLSDEDKLHLGESFGTHGEKVNFIDINNAAVISPGATLSAGDSSETIEGHIDHMMIIGSSHGDPEYSQHDIHARA